MEYKQKDNELRLFKNKYKNSDNHPDMTGKGLVSGKKVKVSAWANKDKNGSTWLKVSIKDDIEETTGGMPL